MSAVSQVSDVVTTEVIHNAVTNSEQSKMLVQKLVNSAIPTILWYRTDISRQSFISYNFNDLTLYQFQNVLRNPQLKYLSKLMICAIEAFKKNYLRELYLVFMTSDQSAKVLEKYKFTFKYENNSIADQKATKDCLVKSTMEFFKSIVKTAKGQSILKNNEIDPEIYISFYEEESSLNHLLNFEAVPHESQKNFFDICKTTEQYVLMSIVKTGYHTVKSSYRNSNMIPAKRDSELQANALDPDLIEDADCGLNKSSSSIEEVKIKCICTIKLKLKNISLINCTHCGTAEHTPCLGYLNAADIQDHPYRCDWCKYDCSNFTTLKDARQQQLKSLFRLSIIYMHLNKSVPNEIFNKLNERYRSSVLKKLLETKVIEEVEENGYILNDVIVNKVTNIILQHASERNKKAKAKEDANTTLKKFKTS